MADGAQVRTLDDLKEHFDIEKVVGYFTDGRLLMTPNYNKNSVQFSA